MLAEKWVPSSDEQSGSKKNRRQAFLVHYLEKNLYVSIEEITKLFR